MTARGLGRRFATWADEHPVALWLRLSAVTVAASIAITACGPAQIGNAPAEDEPPESPTALKSVTQACTPEGHRLYKYRAGYAGGLAVVPNDPTCQRGAP